MNILNLLHQLDVYHLDQYTKVQKINKEQEGFLRCQTPVSTVRLKVEGCRVKNGWGVVGWRVKNRGCRIES